MRDRGQARRRNPCLSPIPRAVELVQFKGEKIVELSHQFRLMSILDQIGVPALAVH